MDAAIESVPPGAARRLFDDMRAMPALDVAALPETVLDASLLIPARGADHALAETVRQAHEFLSQTFAPGRFEIVLIPNPSPYPSLRSLAGAPPDRSIEVSRELAARYPDEVRVVTHRLPQGKGAALRTGFAASRGKLVLFTDADLPYRLDFFRDAAQAIESGFDFVTGNRRLPESVFDMPVELLRLAYRRHRLGLAFNRAVRLLMPLGTSDTQAGIKAMSRRLATEAFAKQRCPGFFFDLEIFLTARAQGLKHAELPVTLYLNTEKSTVRVLRESWLAGFWLLRITLRNRFKNAYAARAARPETGARSIPSRYPSTASFGTKFFLWLRWAFTPYEVMAAKLPPRGRILDLGCGHGLFSLALALGSSEREVIGLDHDAGRVAVARQAGRGIANLRFESGTLSGFWAGVGTGTGSGEGTGEGTGEGSGAAATAACVGAACIDVMHYFPEQEQERLFKQAYELLAPGGTLIVREVDPAGGAISAFNRFYEKIATLTGFTRSEQKQQLHFRTQADWEECLKRTGFAVTSERCSHPLFADILYVARKPWLEKAGSA